MKQLLLRAGVFVFSVFVIGEIFFRVVIPASEPPERKFLTSEKMTIYSTADARYGVYAIGNLNQIITHWHINNVGLISNKDYRIQPQKHELAVIGNSNVEGLFVAPEYHLASQLEQLLGTKWDVCSFGFQGANGAHFYKLMQYADSTTRPEAFVLWLWDDDFINGSADLARNPNFVQYQKNSNGEYEEIEAVAFQRSFLTSVLRRSAIVRYLTINRRLMTMFKADPNAQEHKIWANSKAEYDADSLRELSIREQICQKALSRIAGVAGNRPVLILCDTDQKVLYEDGQTSPSITYRILTKYNHTSNIQVVDLSTYLNEDYQVHQKRFNYDIDDHYNAYGHWLLARVVQKELRVW